MLRVSLVVSAVSAVLLGSLSLAEPPPPPVRGVDLQGMSRAASPGDDFFTFANGQWLKDTVIPEDRSGWSPGAALAEQTLDQLRELFERSARARPGSEQRKVGDFYAALMDEAAIEKRGLAPLEPALAAIDAIRDRRALAKHLGGDLRADVDPLNNAVNHTPRLFGLWVAPSFDAPERYAPYLLQGGLGLPDREYYLGGSPQLAAARDTYRAHVTAVFELAGLAGAKDRAERVLALETRMATVHATRAESEDVLKANNPWKRAELAARAPGLDWGLFLGAAGLGRAETIMVWQPAALRGLSALVASEPLDAWKDWLRYHALDNASAFLPRAFVEEQFALERALSGTPALAARWKRAVDKTSEELGWAVGRLYAEEHFAASSKAELQTMVASIVAAFRARIDQLEWMDPATRSRAKEKLSTLYVGIGYPEKWPDIAGLRIVRGDPVGNAQRAELFAIKQAVAKLAKPVDRSEWCMTPQTVNAVNLPIQNALNFPAARLQPPYYDPTASLAVKYASVGGTIGHEISHSFDDQGAQFDAKGRLADWWTADDRAHFAAAGAKLVAQVDAYQPFPDAHVNGKLTLSENIADLAGLAAAHDAWRAAQGGEGPVVDGMTGEQQFFVAFAQSWRSKMREETQRRRLITDGHAPAMYRALIVRNLDAWYQAFDVKPGQRLFLDAAARVRVW